VKKEQLAQGLGRSCRTLERKKAPGRGWVKQCWILAQPNEERNVSLSPQKALKRSNTLGWEDVRK